MQTKVNIRLVEQLESQTTFVAALAVALAFLADLKFRDNKKYEGDNPQRTGIVILQIYLQVCMGS